MHIISIIVLWTLLLAKIYATDLPNGSCYAIQIGSFEESSLVSIQQHPFPKECRIVSKKNGAYAIKCECGDEESIRQKLPEYRKRIPGAFLTTAPHKLFTASTKRPKPKSTSAKPKKPVQKSVSTIIYSSKTVDQQKELPQKKTNSKERLSELIYQVFIYNNDLKNAQKVAQAALRENPKSLLWHKYLADVLSWRGKAKQAFKHYLYLYETQRKKKLQIKKRIDYGNYEQFFTLLGKIYTHPNNPKEIRAFLKLSQKLGKFQEAATALDRLYQQSANPLLLEQSAMLYYQLGEKKEALKRFQKLQKRGTLSLKGAQILSKIYFEKKDFSKALNTLLGVEHLAKRSNKTFWYQLSDLYVYLKQKEKAAKLLRTLCLLETCRQIDYDRLIAYYRKKDPDFVAKISAKAYKIFHKPAYFFTYANIKLKQKKSFALENFLSTLSYQKKKALKKLPLYWTTLATLYQQKREPSKALQAYQQALRLDPNSTEILAQYSWFLLANERAKELSKILPTLEAKAHNTPKLYALIAAIHYKLNHLQKGYRYYKKALSLTPTNIDLKLDLANLLTVLGKKQKAQKIQREIYNKLQQQMRKNPKLLNNKLFLKRYLRASIYFIPAPNYQMVLNHAKNILDKEDYLNLKIAWKIYTQEDDYAYYLSKQLQKPQLWLRTYFAIKYNQVETMRELLYHYSAIIPIEGKIQAQIKTKQIALAKESLFQAIQEAPQNQTLYETKYNLDTQYANKINTSVGYEEQGSLQNSIFTLQNIQHITNRFYLGSQFSFANTKNTTSLHKTPTTKDSSIRLWLKMLLDEGAIEFGGGWRSAKEQRGQYFFSLSQKLSDKFRLKLTTQKNAHANETTLLREEGEKDLLSLQTDYQITPRSHISGEISHHSYRLQSGEELGNETKYHLQSSQKLRFGYPDLLLKESLTYATFSHQGIRDVLPKDYLEGGVGIGIGGVASQRYNSSWKPYAELRSTYHTQFGLSFAGSIGITGRVIGNDYLNLYLNYSRSALDNEALWLLKLTHSYLY